MLLTVGGRTDAGPRAMNQDWLDWALDLGLFVVADGMGGHNAGEVASHLAIQAIREFVAESAQGSDLTWPFPYQTTLSPDANRLLTAVRLANRRVYEAGLEHTAFEGMGTTVVAALVQGPVAVLVSVGDSRIYRWRADRLELLTTDDTWLSAIMGMPDAERASSTHPMRHVLTSVVGTREDVVPTTREEALAPGDRLILCSDGVHGRLDDETMAAVIRRGGSAESLAVALVQEALTRRTSDNATALVVSAE
jgi:PPM family protein phosphatase